MKVIIVGAGVIGMMQAREFAQKGFDVVLVDKGACGTEASWAGGGIISPLYPWRYSDPITALASWSQAYYPNLIQTLEAESDIDPEITRHGLLMLNVDDYNEAVSWSLSAEAWLEPVDQNEIYKLEPQLREGVQEGLWMSQVASVRNPRLLKALYKILDSHPRVQIHEESAVTGFITQGSKVKGVNTIKGESLEADYVVFCTGAWTPQVSGQAGLKIEPVKGQMVLFDAKPGMVNRVVLSGGQYVIPRRDGKVVAGSTLEYEGFDKQPTDHAKNSLADMAIDLFPDLASCPISHHWAGLRPGSPEGIPYIGRIPEYDNVYVNAGHFRNGLVLAPSSVRLLTSLICEEALPVDADPYNPLNRV